MAKELNIPMGTGLNKSNSLSRLKKTQESAEKVIDEVSESHSSKTTLTEILYDDLIPYPNNRKNFFDIELFAENIYRNGFFGGIIVKKLHDENEGKYMIISGHKRWKAIGYILENINQKFMNRHIPSIVLPEGLTDDKIQELNILFNIDSDDLDPKDLRSASMELMKLYSKNTGGKITKEIMEKTAERFKVKTRQLYKYRKINEDLLPELLVLFDQQLITVDEASRYSSLPKEYQEMLFKTLDEKLKKDPMGKISLSEYEVLKEKADEEKNEKEKLHQEIKALSKELKTYKDLLRDTGTDNEKLYERKIQELEKDLEESRKKQERSEKFTKKFKKNLLEYTDDSEIAKEEMKYEVLKHSISSKLAIIDRHILAISRLKNTDYSFDKEQVSRIKALIISLNQLIEN